MFETQIFKELIMIMFVVLYDLLLLLFFSFIFLIAIYNFYCRFGVKCYVILKKMSEKLRVFYLQDSFTHINWAENFLYKFLLCHLLFFWF
jgi:hypothetical protein